MEKEEERIALAVELFKSGYNCSQAVVAAFADLYGMSREDALRVSASFPECAVSAAHETAR